jgi:electron transport complex protein RnfC
VRTVHSFHGGIHPPGNKRQSVRTPIADAGIPPELILPLVQPAGSPATPVVSVGETVLKGQMIATAFDADSLPVHAPTSGTVLAIEDRVIAHPSGLPTACIVIATDGRDEWIVHSGTADYQALDNGALIRAIHDAGVAGMGGAGFVTATKLSPPAPASITTLIINGAECEPYITCDDMLMRERASEIIAGTRILQHLLAPQETLIGVEDNKPEALAQLRAAAQGFAIEIVDLPTVYPSGGEKQLIELLTGRQLPSGTLPADSGVLCLNVATVAAVFAAVAHGRPLISRVVTVTGGGVREPQNFNTLIGTPLRHLLEKAGYQGDASQRILMGGPLMGFIVPDLGVPVAKTTNCVLAATAAELPAPPPALACIRCGLCADACPASLLPQQLLWFAQGSEYAKLEKHNLFDCIECGACAYVCPSSIPLVQYYRASKDRIVQLREEQSRAEASRLRFEAHKQRLQRDELEKDTRREARKRAGEQRAHATGTRPDVEDPIRAAVERARAKKAALQATASEDRELISREHAVASARKRLEHARVALEEAHAHARDGDHLDALRSGIANTEAKLLAAEAALRDYRPSQRSTSTQAPLDDSKLPAGGVSQRNTMTSGILPDTAHAELERLQQLLRQSQDSLARCRETGEQEKVIVALEASVERLQRSIDTAQQRLNAKGSE